MKGRFYFVFVALALLAGVNHAFTQTKFFRITGPAATAIASFTADGNIVWSNAQPGATYTVQTFSTIPAGTNWVDYIELPTTNALNTNQLVDFNPPSGMVFIPAGSYIIGNSIGDSDITNAPPTNVTVSAFYMDVYPVTYNQWVPVYNWATNHGYDFDNPGAGTATNHPVQSVNFYDITKWCNARSQMEGLRPVYYADANLTQVYASGDLPQNQYPTNGPIADWSANGYRLPTEAEWEKSARGGLSGLRFPWGNVISESQANYFSDTNDFSYDLGPNGANSIGFAAGGETAAGTTPVGIFAPNSYGLYDMAGNIETWCWDFYVRPPYPAGSPYLGGTDPHGPATGNLSGGDLRVTRGGDWGNPPNCARCALRGYFGMYNGYLNVGFRCVRQY